MVSGIINGGDILTKDPKREVDNSRALERLLEVVANTAYGEVTLKIQNYKVVLLDSRVTELIK